MKKLLKVGLLLIVIGFTFGCSEQKEESAETKLNSFMQEMQQKGEASSYSKKLND